MDCAHSSKNESIKEEESQGNAFLFIAPPHVHTQLQDLLFKMSLTHEIALDYNFRLDTYEAPKNSLLSLVSETVHNAFWAILEEELSQKPPQLGRILQLLTDIKESFNQILLPHQTKLKLEIAEILDLDLIKQQAEHGVFSFKEHLNYIISLMARLCAPIRDEEIKALSEIDGLIPALRGIIEVLTKMKMDMANFQLSTIKADVMLHSVQYEKNKFIEFLEIKGGGLPITQRWLREHKPQNIQDSKEVTKSLHEAFLDLLVWDAKTPFPETLILDHQRFLKLQESYYKIIILTTQMLIILSSLGSDLSNDGEFKQDLMKHICLLLDEVKSDETLARVLPNIIEQVVNDSNNKLNESGLPNLNNSVIQLLRSQIEQITEPQHAVRTLVKKRIDEFLRSTISTQPDELSVPSSLHFLKEELLLFGRIFQRIVTYNIKVFHQYYNDILREVS